jgi:hypothetical protein
MDLLSIVGLRESIPANDILQDFGLAFQIEIFSMQLHMLQYIERRHSWRFHRFLVVEGGYHDCGQRFERCYFRSDEVVSRQSHDRRLCRHTCISI